jgi:hypothetical protein
MAAIVVVGGHEYDQLFKLGQRGMMLEQREGVEIGLKGRRRLRHDLVKGRNESVVLLRTIKMRQRFRRRDFLGVIGQHDRLHSRRLLNSQERTGLGFIATR